jgi:hypothetical protein
MGINSAYRRVALKISKHCPLCEIVDTKNTLPDF